ncbi:hypothetical protein EJB05_37984, partial [Eragrostis curvula]
MPKDQKEEFLKKRREAYRQRKTKAIANVEQEKSFSFRSDQSGYKEYTLLTTLKGDNSVQQPFLEEVTTSNQENTHSHENMDCFHTSIVHHRQEVERYQIQPCICILTSSEGKQSSAQWSEDHISMSEEQNESLCHPIACTNGDTHTYENPSTRKLTNEKIEAKRASVQMEDSSQCTDRYTPPRDLSNTSCTKEMNTINFSAHTTSSAQPTIIDPKEHKRKRARERYAQMPKDQKEEFLKKRREAYRQRKTKAIANVEQEKSFPFRSDQSGYKEYTLLTTLKGDNNVQQPFLEEVTTSNQENTHSHENMDCFHTSIVHHRQEVERYQIQPCILTSSEGKQSSAQWSGNNCVHDAEDHISMSEEQNESLCHPIACTNGDTHTYENPSTRKLTNEKIEAKRARNRAYYANMTNEQRLARCERQREQYALRSSLHQRMRYTNMTPEQKQAKVDRQKARRHLRRKTLHPESIAMENPMYSSSDESI